MEEQSRNEFRKETIRLEDGRTLIYYDFVGDHGQLSTNTPPSNQEKREK